MCPCAVIINLLYYPLCVCHKAYHSRLAILHLIKVFCLLPYLHVNLQAGKARSQWFSQSLKTFLSWCIHLQWTGNGSKDLTTKTLWRLRGEWIWNLVWYHPGNKSSSFASVVVGQAGIQTDQKAKGQGLRDKLIMWLLKLFMEECHNWMSQLKFTDIKSV